MRLDARTKAAGAMRKWAKTLDSGLTLFNLPGNAHAADLLQWDPFLEWVSPIMKVPYVSRTAVAEPAPMAITPTEENSQRMNATPAASLMPAQEGLVHDNLYAFTQPALRTAADAPTDTRPKPAPQGVSAPQLLLRH